MMSSFGTMIEFDEEGFEQDDEFRPEIPVESQYNLANMKGWFTENQGQIENADVKYVYGASDLSIGFIENGYLIKLTNLENQTAVAKVTFNGANRVMPEGRGELPHRNNYLKGNDSSKWRTGVRNFNEVYYENLYDGIDLIFYTNDKGLKYDFIVYSEVDPLQICWSYEGIDTLNIEKNGDLHIGTPSGLFIEEAPVSYQIIDDEIIEVQSHYWIHNNQIGISISNFNPSAILIIDPMIFSTYFGGSDTDEGLSIIDKCLA